MPKIRKTTSLTIRMLPAEKQAAIELADRLGINVTDVVRLSLYDLLHNNQIPIVLVQQPLHQPQIDGDLHE